MAISYKIKKENKEKYHLSYLGQYFSLQKYIYMNLLNC